MLSLTANTLNMAGVMDDFVRGLRAGLLLLRNTRPRPDGRENPRIIESRRSTVLGTDYDLYEPKSSPRKTFVMIYGLTLKGERDPRLVNFAQSFAESGFRVAIPDLPGLESFRFDEGDFTAIADLVSTLHSEHGGTIGVTAFSAGAGIALTVAAHPTVAGIIDPLLLFGPYYSFAELWDTFLEHYNHTPVSDEEWDHHIFIRMVLAYRNLDSLDLSETEKDELIDLLGNYCWEPSLKRKRLFYERVLKGRDSISMQDQTPDDSAMQKLSPCGKLRNLTSRVLILHDRYDHVVPPQHSERLYEELCSRDMPGAQKLLVTPLLSHVTARSVWKLFDLFRILGIIGEIFR